jgi:uncharacterized hydrophobic protein (TIGR00341 family)
MIPTGKREAVLGVLDDEDVDYAVSDETSGRDYTAIVTFPLPTAAVEPVLDELRNVGIEENAYTVVVQAETVVSERFEALRERYESDESENGNGNRIAREEVVARANEMAPTVRPYMLMTAVSAVVATAGLLLDSPAVVVGSMVIAPLIGPAMATSVGTVLLDRDLFERGVRLQVLGFVLGIAVAAVFAYLLKSVHLVNFGPEELVAIGEVAERLAPDFLSLVVALAAGFAGAYSLSSGVPSSLVGVAIAVALVPPTAVIGVGIAWGLPAVVVGSTVLVLVNFLSINLAALAVLWYQGYRPRQLFYEDAARAATIKRIGALAVAIALLSVFLGGATFFSYQSAVVEEEVRTDVRTVLDRPAYQDLELIEVTVERGGLPFAPEPQRVIVTVGQPRGQSYPQLADEIASTIDTGQELAIEVHFVEVQVRTPST